MPYTKIIFCCQLEFELTQLFPLNFLFIEIAPAANMTQRVWFSIFPANICYILY